MAESRINPKTGVWDDNWWATQGQYGATGNAAYDGAFAGIAGEVNKYVDELIQMAKGDYDFAAKWIENNYKLALGTDDSARAQFLKQVANEMESKVGRIAFDYNTGSYRVNQDADLATSRTVRTSETALKRLAEDEELERRGLLRENDQARRSQESELNARGILSSPRNQAEGLAGREVGDLEGQIADRMSSFERLLGRSREDIGLSRDDTLADISLERGRALDDLTTGARRGAVDEQQSRDYNLESAKRELERRQREAEAERRRSMNQARTYADYLARGATNTG